jgi:hypothetical protein
MDHFPARHMAMGRSFIVGSSMIKLIGVLLRILSKLRFRMLGLATIKDIPTERFRDLMRELNSNGWRCKYQYEGFDAWIDYGSVKLKKGGITHFEWDNWTEGSVEGPRGVIEQLGKEYAFSWTSLRSVQAAPEL